MRRFHNEPSSYEDSEAYFRMLVLVTVLQRDIGVRFNPRAVWNWSFKDSRDSFLHGLLAGKRVGTCASMPVLYVAVGRRLGYPMHLALAHGHAFVRWETANERINMDASGTGMTTHSDEHYEGWPRPLTETHLQTGQYLRPLKPHEEVAMFYGSRGHCLEDNGELEMAQEFYSRAMELVPESLNYPGYLNDVSVRIRTKLCTTIECFQTAVPLKPRMFFHDPFSLSTPRREG